MELLVFVFGLVMGSFFNVIIYRLPRGESIVYPFSHCPACGTRLGPAELVPVVSYLLQRGRCRHCGAPIHWRYPLVELTTALLYIVLYWRLGLSLLFITQAIFASILLLVAAIDWEHKLIPNSLITAGLLAGFLVLAAWHYQALPGAALGFLVGGGVMLVLAIISRGGLGGGDVKLAALMGFFLGWRLVLLAVLVGFVLGAVFGILLIVLGLKTRKDFIPFGPFLAAASLIALLWGQELLTWYMGHL